MYAVKDFIGKPAPAGYVAGLGRGASGFTTRSDIGPARDDIAPLLPQDEGDFGGGGGDAGEHRYADADETAAPVQYDRDDDEADRIYASVDANMERRRKRKADSDEQTTVAQARASSIRHQFADLKRQLADVSDADWAALPEPGDLRAAGRKLRRSNQRDFFTPTPDAMLASARAQSQLATHIDAMDTSTTASDTPLPRIPNGIGGTLTPLTDFKQINKARDDLLKVRLDQVGDSVSGQSTVDPKGYLTSLSSIVLKSDAEVGDIKKARDLLKSVVATNPKHGPGWIAAARVEEIDGKMPQARGVIARGCEACPKSEDVWLEAARLNTPENARVILANAARELPQSVKIWLRAAQLETEVKAQKRVLRKALEFIPQSVKLWKATIDLEDDPEDARILMSRAVECVPSSVELWLALARLETFENAKKVLNRARAACPHSHEVWIAAARLQESMDDASKIDTIISHAIARLASKGAHLSREEWLKEAETCEAGGSPLTCHAIVRATIGMDVEEDDRKRTWMEDAEGCIARKSIETARAIYEHAVSVFPHKKSIWRRAAFMEKEHGTRESLEALLQRAVQQCPHAEVLWLMAAKEKWNAGDLDGARSILMEAFKANPNSEEIWLAAVKLEVKNDEYQRGRILLQKAREQASTERVWLKSIVLERNLKNYDEALELLKFALEKYPVYAKFWMIQGQIYESLSKITEARETYAKGVKQCPNSTPLWILASRLEEKSGAATRARAILDKARLSNPNAANLWLEAFRIEKRAGQEVVARNILNKALQECPTDGELWTEAIFIEPRHQRKSKSVDALKKSQSHPLVVTACARLFWFERHLDKARSWFQKAIKIDAENGDIWGWWYKFELEHGDDQIRQDVLDKFAHAEPRRGTVWNETAKDPENWRRSNIDILKIVSQKLE